MLVNQMNEMDEEQHFRCFRMSKYLFDDLLRRITPYIQHRNTSSNSVGVFQRPAVVLRIPASGSLQQFVASVGPQSHPFCKPISFPPQQVECCLISVSMIERSAQPTNQNVRQIKMMSVTLQVLTTHSYAFFTSSLS